MSVQGKYTSKVIKEIFGDTNPLDPDYDIKAEEERFIRVDEEVERLMSNPIELLDVDIEKITEVLVQFRYDTLLVGVGVSCLLP